MFVKEGNEEKNGATRRFGPDLTSATLQNKERKK